MTWFADEILLVATPAAMRVLRAKPLLWAHAHHVKSVANHDGFCAETVHGLPAQGVLVVRPMCAPSAYRADWYAEPVLDPARLAPACSHAHLLDAATEPTLSQDDEADGIPAAMRQALAELACEVGQPVLYYSCGMSGGVDYEYALLYEPAERLLMGEMFANDAMPLREGLRGIGVELPTPYFALHTRTFDWNSCKLPPAP